MMKCTPESSRCHSVYSLETASTSLQSINLAAEYQPGCGINLTAAVSTLLLTASSFMTIKKSITTKSVLSEAVLHEIGYVVFFLE
jgi:hypothetical protein